MNTPLLSAHTVRMEPPTKQQKSLLYQRRATETNQHTSSLIEHEKYLRKTAYQNTTINTTVSFFDDSDMVSSYYLVVVFDKLTNTPLLSSRHFYSKKLIEKCLKGEDPNAYQCSIDINDFEEGSVFLADRLSGNIDNPFYLENRSVIFTTYYSEILAHNKNSTLILMVRKEAEDKQLKKYLHLGFQMAGSTVHKGKVHWIIFVDLKKI